LATKAYEFERMAVQQISSARQRIGAELSKVIIGQQDVIDHLLIAVLSGGHCLITGENAVGQVAGATVPSGVPAYSVYAGPHAGGHYGY